MEKCSSIILASVYNVTRVFNRCDAQPFIWELINAISNSFFDCEHQRLYLASAAAINCFDRLWSVSKKNGSPPDDGSAYRAQIFFDNHEQLTSFGKDFFDWYNGSLIEHGKSVLSAAVSTFNGRESPFRGIAIGAKVPGIHWRMAIDRSAELAAGLIRTSDGDINSDSTGHGYRAILSVFQKVHALADAPQITLHFTCLEMDDGSCGLEVGSLAKGLVRWVAAEAHRQAIPIKGENALSGAVYDNHAWDNMTEAINQAGYDGLTVLRMSDIRKSELGQGRFAQLALAHKK